MDRLVLGPELLKEMEEIVKQVQGNLKVAAEKSIRLEKNSKGVLGR